MRSAGGGADGLRHRIGQHTPKLFLGNLVRMQLSTEWHDDGLDGLPWFVDLPIQRPDLYDTVILENTKVYASYTKIGNNWIGGLFTRRALTPGETIARYEGKLLTNAEADASASEYLMTAVDMRDRRKRVVIDGHPKYNNLAGYANYASDRVANVEFEDRGKTKGASSTSKRTNIVLQAKHHIPVVRELRVDYDMGAVARPFRQQMIAQGVSAADLDSPEYKRVTWRYPRTILIE